MKWKDNRESVKNESFWSFGSTKQKNNWFFPVIYANSFSQYFRTTAHFTVSNEKEKSKMNERKIIFLSIFW